MACCTCWELDEGAWSVLCGPRPGLLVEAIHDDQVDSPYLGVRVGEATIPFVDGGQQTAKILEAGGKPEVIWVEEDHGVLHLVPEGWGRTPALLLCSLEPGKGENSYVAYKAVGGVVHVKAGDKVVPVYPTFPGRFIRVLAEHGHTRLLYLAPDSRFRIVRGGRLEHEPSQLDLRWDGFKWHTRARPNIRLNGRVRLA